jgi:Dehydrogenases with different specificities (related to short-chain alcohol dehydrogenases)
MSKRVEGKIALVTGAAQGIGKATAETLAREGALVVVSDINDEKGKEVAAEIGGSCVYIHLDVQEEGDWKKAADFIMKRFGKLHVIVNNAGITGFQEGFGPQDPEHASLSSWRKVHAVNADGVFLGCKYGMQMMKGQKGSIINLSSRSGVVGIPGAAAYAASKASVRNHTKSVALYCCQQGYNIRCNSVHPAAILTPMWEAMLGDGPERESRIAAIAKDIPMHRMGTAEEVAKAVLFLASDDSSYITGIELTMDGGILAGSAVSPQKQED